MRSIVTSLVSFGEDISIRVPPSARSDRTPLNMGDPTVS